MQLLNVTVTFLLCDFYPVVIRFQTPEVEESCLYSWMVTLDPGTPIAVFNTCVVSGLPGSAIDPL